MPYLIQCLHFLRNMLRMIDLRNEENLNQILISAILGNGSRNFPLCFF
jgi:hypothetical protein